MILCDLDIMVEYSWKLELSHSSEWKFPVQNFKMSVQQFSSWYKVTGQWTYVRLEVLSVVTLGRYKLGCD